MITLVVQPVVPAWLNALAWLAIAIGMICAVVVARDVWRNPPGMRIMAVVWPLTMLYGGVVAAWFYVRYARTARDHGESAAAHRVSVATGTSHCGAGCSLGDLWTSRLPSSGSACSGRWWRASRVPTP